MLHVYFATEWHDPLTQQLHHLLDSPITAQVRAGLLLPEGFSRCCPQPGYRSGSDQGGANRDPRPAPLHGPGHPQDAEHGHRGFAGDREHRQPARVAQARPHAEDYPRDLESRDVPH
jgi:hypothetical protein